jgi:hypothetical protein
MEMGTGVTRSFEVLLFGMWLFCVFLHSDNHRLSGMTGDVARDLLILTVELPGKPSDNSWVRRNNLEPGIELIAWRGGRAPRRVSNGFGIDGGISNENGDAMLLLVTRGLVIGAASAK